MMFKAKYIPITTGSRPLKSYWRTIPADTINEAMAIAKRYVRKGYMLQGILQSMGAIW